METPAPPSRHPPPAAGPRPDRCGVGPRRPGFVAVDLVTHEGSVARGEYACTLDVTDIVTGWTETRAVRNKSQERVVAPVKPKLYCTCGTEDDFRGDNVRFRDEIAQVDSDVVYEEWPGGHDWTFFNESYRRALKRCFAV